MYGAMLGNLDAALSTFWWVGGIAAGWTGTAYPLVKLRGQYLNHLRKLAHFG